MSNSVELDERFDAALVLARRLHAAQRRKSGGEPYVAHLLAVAAIVLEHGGGQREAIAALLHDAIEDQGGEETRALIAARFGEAVASIVDGCSDASATPKPPWRERKQAFVERLAAAPASVRLVVGADKLHNVRDLRRSYAREGDALWARFKGGRDGTLWYYRAVRDALGAHGAHPLVGLLASEIAALEREVAS